MRIKFKCPKCKAKGAKVEEIVVNAVISSTVKTIDVDGYVHSSQLTAEEGEVDRYQCFNCGLIIANNGIELYKWLGENGMLKKD